MAMTNENPFTQEEIDLAAQGENDELATNVQILLAKTEHLSNRVVILRANLHRLQDENTALHTELNKLKKRKAPADRSSTKKPTPKAKTTKQTE